MSGKVVHSTSVFQHIVVIEGPRRCSAYLEQVAFVFQTVYPDKEQTILHNVMDGLPLVVFSTASSTNDRFTLNTLKLDMDG